MSTLTIELAGETMLLHPQRALLWPRRRTAFVADLHLGKSDFLRRHGLAIPTADSDPDLDRLSALVREQALERLIVLGDLVHARPPPQARWLDHLRQFRSQHQSLALQLVGGNHDRHVDPGALGFTALGPRWLEAPFVGVHAATPDPAGYTLGGHVHPVMRLGGRHARLRVPVFWQQSHGLTLPAFGALTGGFAIRPSPGERVYAVGDSVLAVR